MTYRLFNFFILAVGVDGRGSDRTIIVEKKQYFVQTDPPPPSHPHSPKKNQNPKPSQTNTKAELYHETQGAVLKGNQNDNADLSDILFIRHGFFSLHRIRCYGDAFPVETDLLTEQHVLQQTTGGGG